MQFDESFWDTSLFVQAIGSIIVNGFALVYKQWNISSSMISGA